MELLYVKDHTNHKFIVVKSYYEEFITEYEPEDVEHFEITDLGKVTDYVEFS